MAFQAVNRQSSGTPTSLNDTAMADASDTPSKADEPVAQAADEAPAGASVTDDKSTQADGGGDDDAATYGTRSRNRTGNSRPNYSEDQDYDYDFVSSAATTSTTKKVPQTTTAAVLQALRKDVAQPAATQAATSSAAAAAASNAKDAANPKKRKAVPAQTTSTTASAPSTAAANTTARKTTTGSPTTPSREIAMMTFTKSKACLNKKGELVADDGSRLSVNDHVYLVCEPPGDPYYLCRIMEFLHSKSEDTSSPVDSLRVNWYYRPRDVQRFNSDSRLVYATMHSDMCPLTSLRGKCTIKHRSEFADLDAYRKERDSFYFIQVFDRFIRRWYECISTSAITNVPEKVKKALDERWKFVAVEASRVRELTSAVKTCKRCSRYCASSDSVDCAICGCSYHMNCVQPPLPKKPSRGFAWACGPCSRASEQQKEARNTPIGGDVTDADEEVVEEEAPAASNESTRAPSLEPGAMDVDEHIPTEAEIAQAKMWPMRYLGIHCRVEDALQYDDTVYPRASSRLGPRHQAPVLPWPGRPFELIKPTEIKKEYLKGNGGKLSKKTIAQIETDRIDRARRQPWQIDEPVGYVARGEDYPNDDPRCTAKLIFKRPDDAFEQSTRKAFDEKVFAFEKQAMSVARRVGVPPFGVNFLDKAAEIYTACDYDSDKAVAKLQTVNRVKDLHEPVLTKSDLAKFEDGVAKYGSEHRLIRLHMKTTLSHADVVRFYYLWKKTPKGKEIWGNYPGRKGKKRAEDDTATKLAEQVAHDVDDSAYDNDKASKIRRGFLCKFCNTTHSRQWRRAPNTSAGQTLLSDARTLNKDKKERLLLALCNRCAGLWRRYAIQWEDLEEVNRKIAAGGGKALKRRLDEELLRELLIANEAANATPEPTASDGSEPPKKKSKVDAAADALKKKPTAAVRPLTPEPPPIVPIQPTMKVLPCAVCHTAGDTVVCGSCMLTVHRSCYGMPDVDPLLRSVEEEWNCDQCQNDRNPTVSTEYSCTLCLTEVTMLDLVDQPKISNKKKSDRDREKERMEKELADAMRQEYINKQVALNRPLLPREPLKKTTGNNWVHVYCAIWTPEIRFSNAKALEVAEGFQLIPAARHEAVCKLCKNRDHANKLRNDKGACVSCFQCQAPFHVSCAFEAGYQFGFDVTPVKGSRKDQVTVATLAQETGSLTPGIWCKDHVIKTIVHPMHEIADDTGRTALQVYVESYKQADLALTGTVRKAQLAQSVKDKGQVLALAAAGANRRESTAHSIAAAVKRGARTSTVSDTKVEDGEDTINVEEVDGEPERRCVKCKIDVTPRWHAIERSALPQFTTPNYGRPGEANANGNRLGVTNGHSWESPAVQNGHALSNGESDATPQDSKTQESDYLCHKCFLKKKLDPTPPPPAVQERERTPPRPYVPPAYDWHNSHPQAQAQPPPMARSWEDPRASQPPPGQPVHGYPPQAYPPGPTTLPQSYPPSYHPGGYANGAPPAPHVAPLAPPPQIHDTRPPIGPQYVYPTQSQPYGPPRTTHSGSYMPTVNGPLPTHSQHAPAPSPPVSQAYPPARPPSHQGYMPAATPLTNGGPPQHTPQHSAYPPPPPSHNAYVRQSPYSTSTQLPAIGQPQHTVTPAPQHAASAPPREAAPSQPPQAEPLPAHNPAPTGSVPPSTPRDAEEDARATPAPNGASASPSVRNLLL